ncbi:Thioredoxin-like protein 1 [Entomortierella chlamydospora]|uniref:Thioredoxin-like protein 1 n=1 Tax=Entomortierella chlamydospora TaxID=101097 RepID=A0A9P6MYH8_9FUNG|nr:Thioredoxin-like protein 1 [Entomortierella chlamydospora]KAG0017105.1 Thioredoxin-like protein 1 [Entomortierella chlamydospora]
MPVKGITSQADYQNILSGAGATKLVVVDFTAAWCGPCQTIKPIFEKLSNQYRHVTFVKVDVDEFQEVAAVAGVTAMPTFQFFKANKKIAEMKGANAVQLETLIKQHQGPAEDAGGASGSGSLVAGHSDISDQITLNQVDCLNQQTANHVRNALKADETYLESDVDEQLIISVPFNQAIKLHSLKIVPKDVAHAPKTIKLYVNRLTLGFDEADSVQETQTIVLSESDYEGNGLISLRFVKFQNVTSVILFIEDNLGDEETTQIKQLVFIGSPLDSTDMSALKKVEHEH